MCISEGVVEPLNKLLAALPEDDYQRLVPHLEKVSLTKGQVIYEVGETIEKVYFPTQGVISLVSITENGATSEIGLIGYEGMVGLPVFLGGESTNNRAIVQIAGDALMMNAQTLKTEFNRAEGLQKRLLPYAQALLTQVSQTAVCNGFHTIEQRLARWLLLVRDCSQTNELPLTQELIATMVGIRRSGVTVAAGMLSKAGIISYKRGLITILDQQALEALACECYYLVKSEFIRLVGN